MDRRKRKFGGNAAVFINAALATAAAVAFHCGRFFVTVCQFLHICIELLEVVGRFR